MTLFKTKIIRPGKIKNLKEREKYYLKSGYDFKNMAINKFTQRKFLAQAPVYNIIGFKAQLSPKNQVANKKTSLPKFYTPIFLDKCTLNCVLNLVGLNRWNTIPPH